MDLLGRGNQTDIDGSLGADGDEIRRVCARGGWGERVPAEITGIGEPFRGKVESQHNGNSRNL